MSNPQAESVPKLTADLQNSVANFKKAARDLSDLFRSEFPLKPPPTLYHYTTDAGLYGILESGSLWLSDIFFLNDPSELRHGISLAVTVLKNLGIDSLPEGELLKYAIASLGGPRITITGNYFSCSFSRNGNDLDQWRAYADDGRGYSIAFDGISIDKAFCNSRDKSGASYPSAFPLTYDDQKLIGIFQQLISSIKPISDAGSSDEMQLEYFKQITKELARRIIFFSVHFKHVAYGNEEEYRFFEIIPVNGNSKMMLRAKAHELIRYREFNWREAGLIPKRITIGPAADQEKAATFARKCIRGYDEDKIEIVESGIPYKSKLAWLVKSRAATV